MPTYSYICDSCGHRFDELQSMTADALVTCPDCGKDQLRRVISGGSGLIFKGSGFYITDYANKSSSSSSSSNGATDKSIKKSKPAEKSKKQTAEKSDSKD
ncbi:MAG: zinc ribbon domain-containing protein [Candidatus Marinimicrobia bacterium]|nr:zinc ribbon domain-containing protein [Candidatus Neomarinimicrobiota bacterium]